MKLFLITLAGLTLMAETSGPPLPGRYLDLQTARDALETEAWLLTKEMDFAKSGKAYILFDGTDSTMHFRIGGRTLKTCTFENAPDSPQLPPGSIIGITRVGTGGPVLLPPDTERGRDHALVYNDHGNPDQTAEEATAIPTDEHLLGVEAPANYTVQTDRGLSLHIGPVTGSDEAGLVLATDAATARSLYYSLRPGTPIIVVQSTGFRNR